MPRTGHFAKMLFLAALLVLISGLVYEQVGEWQDHKHFPQIGRSVDIGGRSLNIFCSGEGGPAVVFDSGHGQPGYSWLLVQREVAHFTRACWYDRAGMGWSDPGPDPNWSDSVARDLHKLLQAAEIPPPYVLVGHSLAAFNVRMYYALYPDEVAGMVLVDPTPEDTDTRNPAMPRRRAPNLPRAVPHLLISTLGRLGAFRLTALHHGSPPRGFTAEQWATLSALQRQFKTVEADFQEGPALPSARQVQAAPGLGNLPLVVLSAGAPRGLPAEAHQINLELHGEIARRSTRGKQITLEQSGHMIPYDAPEALIEAVREVVSDARHDHGEHQATANPPAGH